MNPPWNKDALFLAYRQAKTALFFERRGVGLIDLAVFEHSLDQRLGALTATLSSNGGWFDDLPVGRVWLAPKKLVAAEKPNTDPRFLALGLPESGEPRNVEVQVRLAPSPEIAIVEVLFLWQFGPALQSVLSNRAIGYRLDLRKKVLSPTRRWLFEYWPSRYDEFRAVPINVALAQLKKNRSVLLLGADLTRYYDGVDASFLLTREFRTRLHEASAQHLLPPINAEEYTSAVKSLLAFYRRFHRDVQRRTGIQWRNGIPIGSVTSRLVANVALATLDSAIMSRDDVLSYRRYVDDFVLVCRPSLNSYDSVRETIRRHIPHAEESGDGFSIDSRALERPGSEFRIHEGKCWVRHLGGSPGGEFLRAVRAQIGQLASGSRAFLDPVVALEGALPNLIRVTSSDRPLTVLREADRLRLEHWNVSTRLRSLERVSLLLDPDSAREVAERALAETKRFLANSDDWVDNLEQSLRLLRLAIRVRDFEGGKSLVRLVLTRIERHTGDEVPGTLTYAGEALRGPRARADVRAYVVSRLVEAICSVLRPADFPRFAQRLWPSGSGNKGWPTPRQFNRYTRLLAASDLRTFDREDDRFGRNTYEDARADISVGRDDRDLLDRLHRIKEFVTESTDEDDPWRIPAPRLFLCTRPPSYTDIATRALRNAFTPLDPDTFTRLQNTVNAVRGTEYGKPVAMVSEHMSIVVPSDLLTVRAEDVDPRILVGNLVTPDEYYEEALKRPTRRGGWRSVRSHTRLRGVMKVLAEVERRATKRGRRNLCILPELSLPREWFREVASHVAKMATYGLVVGLEYWHARGRPVVANEVYAVIPTGYRAAFSWRWTKGKPAREEDARLSAKGLQFVRPRSSSYRRAVLETMYGRMSVLICSEMIEARRVADLLGRVEIVAVPAWNPDTASYSHLIQSVGFQLNAMVAIANNGVYSDCRVWGPREERWERDMCRLIERGVDDVLAVDVNLGSLREFRRAAGGQGAKGLGWRPLPPDWPDKGDGAT